MNGRVHVAGRGRIGGARSMGGARVRPTATWIGAAIAVAVGACAPTGGVPESPRPSAAPEGALPPIPARRGPLALDVVYPQEGAAIAARDSTFVYGSTGTGDARLWIDGTPVPVQPNGAFLAFLPVPPAGVYRFLAVAGEDSVRLERKVRVPPPQPLLSADSATILDRTIAPRGAWAALPGERIAVSFRGTPGGIATLVLPDGSRIPLVERSVIAVADEAQRAFARDTAALASERVRGVSEYMGEFPAMPLATPSPAIERPTLAEVPTPTRGGFAGAILELVVRNDTARAPLPLNLALLDPDRLPVAETFDPEPLGRTGDGITVGRPGPGYTYAYFWPDGTRLTLTGQRNGEYRVRLAPDLTAWVDARDVRLLPRGTPVPTGRVGTVRFAPGPKAVDVRIELADRFPFRVDEGDRSITVTIYGGTADTDWLQYRSVDPFIRVAEWEQPADGIYRLTLDLEDEPWGYQTAWAANGDLVLRIRRPPAIDPERPLRGLLVAVDPGHPPAGANGPTGLTEAQANLAIALRLRPLLEEAGARVLMTRTDMTPVPLQARTHAATAADADILVSVHNNAFPDGVNPFANNGTSVYYFHRHSVDLARSLQRALLEELGLRDLGIGRGNLALVRPTWMPAALTETMYMMIPRQEAALRDPAVQERIARAHVRGLEEFLRGRAFRRERSALP